MANERILQLQLALFFDSIEERPDRLKEKIDDALGPVFDAMPTMIPIPDGAPPELPMVIMKSKDGVYQCNIARSRIDFTVVYANSNDSSSLIVQDFIEKIRPFSALIFGFKNINRFGMVGQYFFKSTDPVNKIQSKHFKNNLGELEELAIRFNKRFEYNGKMFNDVLEISKGTIQDFNKSTNGIVVQRDMNNVPSENLKIEEFISIITNRQDNFKMSGISRYVQ